MKQGKPKIAVTGLGVVSPLGNDLGSFWESLVAGKSGVGPVTKFDASGLEARIAAEVRGFEPGLWMDRKEARKMALFSQYAVAAAIQAWTDADLGETDTPAYDPERSGICLGNGIGGLEIFQESYAKLLSSGADRMPPMTVPMMIANEAAANVAIRLGVRGPALTQVTACASGTDAIGMAMDLIGSGRTDMVLAGGCEAAVTAFAMGGFCRLKALSTSRNDEPEKASRPFDEGRDGFVIGEGAAVLVLEDYESALKRGARIYAFAAGYGSTCDAYHLTAPDPSGAQGSRALGLALSDAGIDASRVGYYNAHGTSTQLNDSTETAMVKRTFGAHASRLKISSTKSMLGHALGAAGALEALICVKALQTSTLPPTINLEKPDLAQGCDLDYIPNMAVHADIEAALSASLGFGGHNAALAFARA